MGLLYLLFNKSELFCTALLGLTESSKGGVLSLFLALLDSEGQGTQQCSLYGTKPVGEKLTK